MSLGRKLNRSKLSVNPRIHLLIETILLILIYHTHTKFFNINKKMTWKEKPGLRKKEYIDKKEQEVKA